MIMKKLIIISILAILLLTILNGFSNTWNTPDKGYFTCQKDIEKDVTDFSKSAASVYYEGKLFYFVLFNDAFSSKIILRKLTNTINSSDNFQWSVASKEDNMTNLTNGIICKDYYQFAPVVFNGSLLLFLPNVGGYLSYSVYSPSTTPGLSSWSALKTPFQHMAINQTGKYIAAVVVEDKLCLFSANPNSGMDVYWTKDLEAWSYAHFENAWRTPINYDDNYNQKQQISLICKSFSENNVRKSKIMMAYLDKYDHARCSEFRFNDQEVLQQISDNSISVEFQYRSVQIVEGSVQGDPSSGELVQAFLKLENQDNGYVRYRIQRYQLSNNTWTKQENNLVKQNYCWSSSFLNPCAINYPVSKGDVITNYMCLIYRGYDDWDHPLNCAWSVSDHYNLVGNKQSISMSSVKSAQYIGYIEGPPPFYLNSKDHLKDPYINPACAPISQVEYSHTEASSTEETISVDVETTSSVKIAGFKAELGLFYEHKWGKEYKTTIEQSIDYIALEEIEGHYFLLKPTIDQYEIRVYDAHNNYLYTTYYMKIGDVKSYLDPFELPEGLVPDDPDTYHNRGIPFSDYISFGHQNVNWVKGSETGHAKIEVESETSNTNNAKVSVSVEFELGEIWNLGVSGNFEWEQTTKTLMGNAIDVNTRLNQPDPNEPKDVKALSYTIWWLQKTPDLDTWWFYPGQDTAQETWCLTYEVYQCRRVDNSGYDAKGEFGSDEGNAQNQQEDLTSKAGVVSNETTLGQNFPNPFSEKTRIIYTIGSKESGDEQACHVNLKIYDMNGRLINTLTDEKHLPGNYEAEWNASGFAPGIYYYSLETENFRDVKKLILLN